MKEEEAVELLKKAGCSDGVIAHCIAVSKVARRIAEGIKKRGHKVDVELVVIGALLHDIGRAKTHGIDHGVVGGKIARELGLPADVIRIIERHILSGLTAEEAKKFGLEERNLVPEKLEEKIVTYADKLIDKNKLVPIEHTIRSLEKWLGEESSIIKRLKSLSSEIQTLCPSIERYVRSNQGKNL